MKYCDGRCAPALFRFRQLRCFVVALSIRRSERKSYQIRLQNATDLKECESNSRLHVEGTF